MFQTLTIIYVERQFRPPLLTSNRQDEYNNSKHQKAPDPSVTRAADMDPSIRNDELVLNPQGRTSSDAAKGQADQFIKLRTPFHY